MVPRTQGKQELYYCDGHSKMGDEFCDQKTIPRAVIDEAVYTYFERRGVDSDPAQESPALAENNQRRSSVPS
jgi:hypothetical protein